MPNSLSPGPARQHVPSAGRASPPATGGAAGRARIHGVPSPRQQPTGHRCSRLPLPPIGSAAKHDAALPYRRPESTPVFGRAPSAPGVNRANAAYGNDRKKKRCRNSATLFANVLSSGKKGIRTPETLLRFTRFPGGPVQPLLHLSVGMAQKYAIFPDSANDGDFFCTVPPGTDSVQARNKSQAPA